MTRCPECDDYPTGTRCAAATCPSRLKVRPIALADGEGGAIKRRRYKSRKVPFEQRYIVVERGFGTPCFEWQWSIHNTGYGRFGKDGKRWFAHRYAYTVAKGPIPEGLSIDHLCRNPLCVNPDHLEAVTLQENTRRQLAANPPKRGPKCGHPQEADWTVCRICARARQRRYDEKKRAKKAPLPFRPADFNEWRAGIRRDLGFAFHGGIYGK